MIKYLKKNVSDESSPKLMIQRVVTNYILISGLFLVIISSFNYYPWISISPKKCYIAYMMGTFLYGSNKTCIYYSYFLRLDITYNNAKGFGVNNCVLNTCYILTTAYFFITTGFQMFLAKPAYFKWSDEFQFCEHTVSIVNHPIGIIIWPLVTIFELSASISALTLFLKPLCRLKRVENDRDLHELIIKFGLLNSIMIVSSLFAGFVYALTTGAILLFVDSVINSICLILMKSIHDILYKKLCVICISCKCCKYSAVPNLEGNMSNTTQNDGSGEGGDIAITVSSPQ